MSDSRIRLLTGIFIALVLTASAYLYWGANLNENSPIDRQQQDYKTFKRTLRLTESMIYDRLVESSYLLAENSTFKANLQLNDKKSLNYSAREFALFLKTDLFAIINNQGTVNFDYNKQLNGVDSLANILPIKRALMGYEPEIELKDVNLLNIKGNVYQVVAVPVFAGKEKILGVILMGVNFVDFVLKPLARANHFDLYFYFENQLILQSNPSADLITSRFLKNRAVNYPNKIAQESTIRFKSEDQHKIAFFKQLGIEHKASLISVYNPDKNLN